MDTPSRVPYLTAALVGLTVLLAVQAGAAAVFADAPNAGTANTPSPIANGTAEPLANDIPAGSTLISVQSFGGFVDNGRALVVSPSGETLWEFDPEDTRIFDAELLDNGNVLLATAIKKPGEECSTEYQNREHCVMNRIVELSYDDKAVVWEYTWHDAFIHWHEVHDVDRLDNGETAIIDMGNNRAFTVNEEKEITWSWDAETHLAADSEFQEQYGGPDQKSAESDWTHMNDIDRLENGNFLMSIRNFDVTIEVNRSTKDIDRVIGRPGSTDIMHQQHNPQWLPERGTLLVADSENDRVVEVRPNGSIAWKFGGSGLLSWPRDADRLPNGNTLITDTYNNRVIEVTPEGEVVWEHSVSVQEDGKQKGGLVYSADRLSANGRPLDEEQSYFGELDGETATPFPDARYTDGGFIAKHAARIETFASFYFPSWVKLPELVTMAFALLTALWIAGEFAFQQWRNR